MLGAGGDGAADSVQSRKRLPPAEERKEENAVIFFITDYTEVSGYVYYSNQTAFDWMKNCAQIENINDHWMMVQMYE